MMMMMVSDAIQRQRGDVISPDVQPSVHDKVYECDRKRSSSHGLSLDVAQLHNNQHKHVGFIAKQKRHCACMLIWPKLDFHKE